MPHVTDEGVAKRLTVGRGGGFEGGFPAVVPDTREHAESATIKLDTRK